MGYKNYIKIYVLLVCVHPCGWPAVPEKTEGVCGRTALNGGRTQVRNLSGDPDKTAREMVPATAAGGASSRWRRQEDEETEREEKSEREQERDYLCECGGRI